jgi:hypothetical protein
VLESRCRRAQAQAERVGRRCAGASQCRTARATLKRWRGVGAHRRGAGAGPAVRATACEWARPRMRAVRAYAGVTLAATVQGRKPDLQAGADMGKHGKETVASLGHRHKWSTPDEGRRIEREDASSLAREMHEERQAGRKGGKAEVAIGCNELGGATHDELPSSMRKSRQEQRSAGSTRSARPAVVVGRP